jgi:hypothetical protein
MIVLKVNEGLLNHCLEQVSKYNFGQRYTANGNKEQQLTGLIGQSIVMNLFGLDSVEGSFGFDDGVDINYNGLTIDVKTMGRTTDVRSNYTNNFLKLQDYFNTNIYVFCSYNKTKKELTICGWISKEAFINKRRYYPKGTVRTRFDGTTFITFADLFEIDIQDLNDINNIDDFKTELNNLNVKN